MSEATVHPGAVYTLPLMQSSLDQAASEAPKGMALSEPLLRNNIVWFCRLRWGVVGLLTSAGVLGNSKASADFVGLLPMGYWPFVCAAVLVAANLTFLWHARNLRNPQSARVVSGNLWAQIIVDLLVLTVVVHFVGSTTTFIAFAYLFHVVLACIFFPARWSLIVTLLAQGLFVLCVLAEHSGLIPAQTIFSGSRQFTHGEMTFDVASAVLIWTVVWHLASHLSTAVRRRDLALADANLRLLAAQEERARHMLTTTHQLKSPFAAIHAYTQRLLVGDCGPLSERAIAVAQRMAARCRRMAREIQEILQLGNLSSMSQAAAERQEIDLVQLIRACLAELDLLRQDRNLRLELDLQEATVLGVEDHFRMLIGNLLSNAMSYSHPDGAVTVRCGLGPDGLARVTIADEGIGIAPLKLPRIFDEYYRTNEAVEHNPESSGLGLAIVKHVALLHQIEIRVESTLGAGTSFHLAFSNSPPVPTTL